MEERWMRYVCMGLAVLAGISCTVACVAIAYHAIVCGCP